MKSFQAIEHVSSPELVRRKIAQASAPMFIREFCQNAIEAARFAALPRVKWWEMREAGCRKLYVWNNGRGMDKEELLHNMNLGASGSEKIQSAADNFGLGAKLTGLKANPAGLLWRSCKSGTVYQLLLGWNDDVPGIIAVPANDGTSHLVLDVSDRYRDVRLSQFDKPLYELSGKPDCSLLEFDWTLVVFLGHDIERQDTVVDPLGDGDPKGGRSYWLPQRINRRYYDLTEWNVTAICDLGDHGEQSRRCPGLRHLDVEQEETVYTPDLSIRYCLLKQGHASNEQAKGFRGHAALIFRNEIYDGLFDQVWTGHASRFGVIAGSSRIAVQLVLHYNFRATPNEQRTALEEEFPHGERKPVRLENYEELVERHLPQFICDYIAAEDGKRTGPSENLTKRLKEVMVKLGLRAPTRAGHGSEFVAAEPNGDNLPVASPQSELADAGEPQPSESHEPSLPPPSKFGGGKPAIGASERNLDVVPRVVWDKTKRDDNSLIGSFDARHGLITLYEDHPVLDEVVRSVIDSGVPTSHRLAIRNQAKEQIGYAVGRHVLVAQAMLKRRLWTTEQRDMATFPQALTASVGFADMHRLAVEIVFRRFKRVRSRAKS